MSSGQPRNTTTTTVQKNEPWEEAKPHFTDMYAKAADALAATNKNPFTGDFIAQPGSELDTALGMLRGNVNSGRIGAGAEGVQQLALDTLSGKYMDPASNPFLAAAGQAAIRPLQQQFSDVVLPGITDQAIMQGAYGGSGQDQSQERAAQGLATASGDILGKMYAENYARERTHQLNAPGMLMESYDFFREPAMELMKIENAQRGAEQLRIDNALAKFQEQKSAPWYGLGEMAQILTAGGFRTTSGTQTQPNPNYVDPAMQWMQGLLGGASMVAGMGGRGGFGFWGRDR